MSILATFIHAQWSITNIYFVIVMNVYGPVHNGANHIPKAVSDHDPLPDWVRDLNYVRSHALQTAVLIRKQDLRTAR